MRSLVFGTSLTMALVFAGCGDGADDASSGPDTTTLEPTTQAYDEMTDSSLMSPTDAGGENLAPEEIVIGLAQDAGASWGRHIDT